MTPVALLIAAPAWAVALLLVAGLGGPLSTTLAAVGAFRPLLCLLAVPLALLAAALGIRRSAAATAAAGLVATLAMTPDLLARPAEGATHRVVVAANLLIRNPRQAEALEAIAAAGADVVLLQEARRDVLEGPAAAPWPHRALAAGRGRGAGCAILSRVPLTEVVAGGHPCHVAARLPDGAAVMSVHFAWPVLAGQAAQARDAARFAGLLAGPAIVGGDFNAPRWSPAVRAMERAADGHAVPGLRLTWGGSSPVPLLPIDHVILSRDLAAGSARALALPGSDHRAVRVEVLAP